MRLLPAHQLERRPGSGSEAQSREDDHRLVPTNVLGRPGLYAPFLGAGIE